MIIIRVNIVITIIINIMRMARMIVTYSNNNMLVITVLVRKNKSDKNFKKKNYEDENKNQIERKP